MLRFSLVFSVFNFYSSLAIIIVLGKSSQGFKRVTRLFGVCFLYDECAVCHDRVLAATKQGQTSRKMAARSQNQHYVCRRDTGGKI